MLRATPGSRRIRPALLEREHHLVDRRRGDVGVVLHVGLAGARPHNEWM